MNQREARAVFVFTRLSWQSTYVDSENWVNKIHTIGGYLQLYFGKEKISHYWKFAANQKIELLKKKKNTTVSFFKKWLSKIQFQFIFEQQCFTQTGKKINNFIGKKSRKNKPFLFDLYNHLIKLLRVQYVHPRLPASWE